MIRAHAEPLCLTLDVEGPATMLESPAVHERACEELARGVRSIRIDLRDCTTMDSTFSGTLLAVERELEKVGGGHLILVSPSPRVIELLQQMGLEDFYPIEIAEKVDGVGTDITTARPEVAKLRRLVVDAHEALARVPGAADAFRAVVDELRREDGDSCRNSGVLAGAGESVAPPNAKLMTPRQPVDMHVVEIPADPGGLGLPAMDRRLH